MDESDVEKYKREVEALGEWLDEKFERNEEQINQYKEVVRDSFGQAAGYARVITGLGYAGIFTLWGFTKEHINETATFLVAILMSVSLVVFVAWEIYRMISEAFILKWTGALIVKSLAASEPDDIARVAKLGREANAWSQRYMSRIFAVWLVVLLVAVGTASAAVLILIYNFLANAVGWSEFPRYIGYCGTCI